MSNLKIKIKTVTYNSMKKTLKTYINGDISYSWIGKLSIVKTKFSPS